MSLLVAPANHRLPARLQPEGETNTAASTHRFRRRPKMKNALPGRGLPTNACSAGAGLAWPR